MSRFPHFARAFPVLQGKSGDVLPFFLRPNLRTLPKRFGDAYWRTFIEKPAAVTQKSEFYWVLLHAIGLAGSCGFMLHRKHSKYETARRRNSPCDTH